MFMLFIKTIFNFDICFFLFGLFTLLHACICLMRMCAYSCVIEVFGRFKVLYAYRFDASVCVTVA
jgi:hypothetical protein